jgi:hypothetical protein
LISTSILKDNETSKVDREEFLIKHIGKERFRKVQASIAKWADEKGIPMYVPFSTQIDLLSFFDLSLLIY